MEKAYQTYDLFTDYDGTIIGITYTNDNLDRGYPTEYASWNVKYKNLEEALKHTGKTHVGISGVQVIVYIDGRKV